MVAKCPMTTFIPCKLPRILKSCCEVRSNSWKGVFAQSFSLLLDNVRWVYQQKIALLIFHRKSSVKWPIEVKCYFETKNYAILFGIEWFAEINWNWKCCWWKILVSMSDYSIKIIIGKITVFQRCHWIRN